MSISRIVQYAFLFFLLFGAGYMVWQVMSPFISALALAVIIVTICYPMYEKIQQYSYRNNRTLAAATTTLAVVVIIVLPLLFISSIFVKELVSFYQTLGAGQELTIEKYVLDFEQSIQHYLPDFQLNLTEQIRQGAEWLVGNVGAIFAGTISTIFIILISLIGSFYFFRDGGEFLKIIIKISPLPDSDDKVIFSRLARAVRSVATGVLLVSFIQGTLAAIGFTIFGIDRAVLWGAIGAVLALIPGLGTITIMIPGIIYLTMTGAVTAAIGLSIWTLITVIVVDNIIGPQLMSRGNNLHPFIMLTSVLGGVTTFGPMGFIIGPVIVTLFIVLLEVYNQFIVNDQSKVKQK